MQTRTPLITDHKVARLFAWARLWFAGFVGLCITWTASGKAIPRRDLDRVARIAHKLIICAFVARSAGSAPTRNRHGRKKQVTLRILIGSRLRAATRGILALIRDAERHIARLLRRLARGLTRLRVLLPRADSCALISAPAQCAVRADTS